MWNCIFISKSMLAVICDRKNLHGEYVFWISLVDIYLGHVMDHALALKSSTDYPTLLQKSVTEEVPLARR